MQVAKADCECPLYLTELFGARDASCPKGKKMEIRKSLTTRNLYGGNMIAVSTDKGNLSFQSVDDVLKFVQTSAQENIELWISGKQPYPCISVCISGEYAAINYFQNDTGDIWLSYNEENQEDVTFMAAGEEWEPDVNAVISINSAFSCIREFCATYERPCCIQWQEL